MKNTNKNQNNSDDAEEVTLLDFQGSATSAMPLAVDHEIEAPETHDALPEPEPSLGGLIPDFQSEPTAGSDTTETKGLAITAQQLAIIKNLLEKIQEHGRQISDILEPYWQAGALPRIKLSQTEDQTDGQSQIIEGVFNGQLMIGPDGHEYSIAPNYASKSRLVEGDILKLTITANGTFVYKQIQPIDRRRITGVLEETETGEYLVNSEGRRWRILSASVTYYKGETGDQVVIVVPKEGVSKWAAVENIIKR